MTALLLVGIVSAAHIALRAFQQLNVMHDRKSWVIGTSMLMAAAEVYVIVANARAWEWRTVLATGVGAGCGCIAAMLVHEKLRGSV